jgi:hypothetical protein
MWLDDEVDMIRHYAPAVQAVIKNMLIIAYCTDKERRGSFVV